MCTSRACAKKSVIEMETSLKQCAERGILLVSVKRNYYSSSSFKIAALFTALLGASAILLGMYLYEFSRQTFIQETEAAIDIEIEHILEVFANKDAPTTYCLYQKTF